MPKVKDGKHPFTCIGCNQVVWLLPSPKILVNGVVRRFIRRRCKVCENSGTVHKGEKQVFYHTPDAPESAHKERVPASEKYV